MYLADDYWRTKGIRNNINIEFLTGLPVLFSSPHYAQRLTELCNERGIPISTKHNLVEIRSKSKEAIFQDLENKKEVVKNYSFLHVVPPMASPKEIRESPLAAANGYVDVNKDTTQHNKFPNVFSIGDCANLPTSKTAAAITV